jgi:hypothetical protein
MRYYHDTSAKLYLRFIDSIEDKDYYYVRTYSMIDDSLEDCRVEKKRIDPRIGKTVLLVEDESLIARLMLLGLA